ncbi:hypothetical protein C8F04DRAFT_1310803 [Mycena alexandri]|uniref:Uncharacterized protein n=1 Tax=Mycena alexandri TaxID=1745969 RepID=A0AAD6WVE8_9AGAR|nr:hypothetical protein C8F04DRAFT_1310803 [Mycena alexandri]
MAPPPAIAVPKKVVPQEGTLTAAQSNNVITLVEDLSTVIRLRTSLIFCFTTYTPLSAKVALSLIEGGSGKRPKRQRSAPKPLQAAGWAELGWAWGDWKLLVGGIRALRAFGDGLSARSFYPTNTSKTRPLHRFRKKAVDWPKNLAQPASSQKYFRYYGNDPSSTKSSTNLKLSEPDVMVYRKTSGRFGEIDNVDSALEQRALLNVPTKPQEDDQSIWPRYGTWFNVLPTLSLSLPPTTCKILVLAAFMVHSSLNVHLERLAKGKPPTPSTQLDAHLAVLSITCTIFGQVATLWVGHKTLQTSSATETPTNNVKPKEGDVGVAVNEGGAVTLAAERVIGFPALSVKIGTILPDNWSVVDVTIATPSGTCATFTQAASPSALKVHGKGWVDTNVNICSRAICADPAHRDRSGRYRHYQTARSSDTIESLSGNLSKSERAGPRSYKNTDSRRAAEAARVCMTDNWRGF